MANTNTEKLNQHTDHVSYGVELKEVSFGEFDRRKTPRINTYESFKKYIDSLNTTDGLID